jgi:RNA polymerase sigma-70 factor (ECF subfamily)
MIEETMATEEFEQLVDAHYQALFRFGMSLTKDPDRAADLVQQTFCKWAEKGRQLRDRSKAKSWLFTTLHRDFLSRIRRSNRFREEGLDEEEIEQIADETTMTAERQMDGKRALELLHGLDETFRAPLALFYLQQHSYKEIAEILDVPIGTVMSRIARGKELLRRKMTAEPASAPKNVLQIENEERREENHG